MEKIEIPQACTHAESWQVLRSDCNLRWIQLGDATSAGQDNLLRQRQWESILDDLVNGQEVVETNGSLEPVHGAARM